MNSANILDKNLIFVFMKIFTKPVAYVVNLRKAAIFLHQQSSALYFYAA